MEPRTKHPSRADLRATVVSALLSAKAGPPGTAATVDDETPIGGAGLGISSLNMLQALVRIEDELGVAFGDRAVAEADLRSVGAVVDLVEQMLAERDE